MTRKHILRSCKYKNCVNRSSTPSTLPHEHIDRSRTRTSRSATDQVLETIQKGFMYLPKWIYLYHVSWEAHALVSRKRHDRVPGTAWSLTEPVQLMRLCATNCVRVVHEVIGVPLYYHKPPGHMENRLEPRLNKMVLAEPGD